MCNFYLMMIKTILIKVVKGNVFHILTHIYLLKAIIVELIYCCNTQLGHYYGFVEVDWSRIHRELAYRGRQFIRRSSVPDQLNHPTVSRVLLRFSKGGA